MDAIASGLHCRGDRLHKCTGAGMCMCMCLVKDFIVQVNGCAFGGIFWNAATFFTWPHAVR